MRGVLSKGREQSSQLATYGASKRDVIRGAHALSPPRKSDRILHRRHHAQSDRLGRRLSLPHPVPVGRPVDRDAPLHRRYFNRGLPGTCAPARHGLVKETPRDVLDYGRRRCRRHHTRENVGRRPDDPHPSTATASGPGCLFTASLRNGRGSYGFAVDPSSLILLFIDGYDREQKLYDQLFFCKIFQIAERQLAVCCVQRDHQSTLRLVIQIVIVILQYVICLSQ